MLRKMQRQWKREINKVQLPVVLACLLYFGASMPAWAAPTGGVITAGSATISNSGVTTTINQASNKAAINWQSFGIAKGETVRFVQPSASSIALNRVVGSDASAIYGTLSANGQVFLINPNGILFAPGAQVNVAGLVASTLNISDSDFLNGNYRFSKEGKAGSVVNQGNITANNGYVAFLGPQVKNEGIVAARVIGMTAGDKVSLDFNGDSLLKLTVDTVAAGASASNSGSLLADGGTVLMSTGTKDALLSTVVNNSGLIQARTVNNQSGTIILEGGSANIGGTLDASAPNGGNGGFIETSGASVTMAPGLRVTTQAAQGQTGTWLIDPLDFTVAASGGDMTGTTVSGWLAANNVIIKTTNAGSSASNGTDNVSGASGTAGNININDTITWTSDTKLTLSAYNNIYINRSITNTGAGSLALEYGQGAGNSGNTSTYSINAPVNLTAGQHFSTKLGNDGAVNAFTVITDLNALQAINESTGSRALNYFLGADIDASATSGWNSGAGFMPIGRGGYTFKGAFDGGGHTISDLTINRPGESNVGLFGYAEGNKPIANLSLVNANITGSGFVGILAGGANNQISNVNATGSVTGSGQDVGGLVGMLSSGSISNAYATASVNSGGQYVGGLVGYNSGSISNSYATGSVTGTSDVGGLVGRNMNHGTISSSYWDKDTTGQTTSAGSDNANGLTTAQLMSGLQTGFDAATWGIISNTSYPYLKWRYSTTPQVVSGIVKADGAAQAGQTVQTLANGNIVGSTGSGANGFYYMLLDSNTITNGAAVLSYWDGQGSAAKQTTADNQSLAGLDITSGKVTASSSGALDVTALLAAAKGASTGVTRYTVSGNVSVDGNLDVTAAGNVTQTGALTVSGTTTVNAGSNDITLEKAANDFTGAVSLTGNNITLTDANALTLGTITAPGSLTLTAGGNIIANGAISTALFDLKGGNWSQLNASLPTFSATDFRLSGGSFLRALGGDGTSGSPYQISDIYGLQGVGSTGFLNKSYLLANDIVASATSGWNGVAGFKPIGSESSAFTGSFAGAGYTISGLTINLPETNDVGLFGYTMGASLSNVGLVNANVTGKSNVGGLVGHNYTNSTITGSYVTGSVTGINNNVGGLAGWNRGTIKDSYGSAAVSGVYYVGGLVGTNTNSISNSYATGRVSSTTSYKGGLAGANSTTITNSYWNTETSEQNNGAGGGNGTISVAGGGAPSLTTAQMKETGNYASWNTTSIWYLNGGHSAPLLRSFLTPLTVSAASASKVYDGNAIAPLSNVTAYDVNKVDGTLAWSGKNVGSHGLTGLYAKGQDGYLISYDPTSLLTITAKTLTLTQLGPVEKVYDGTTTAMVNAGNQPLLQGGIGGDIVTLTFTDSSAAYDNKNVGDNKNVTLSGLTLGGSDAGNYQLSSTSINGNVGIITRAPLTITASANSKVYDGTTSSSATPTVTGTLYDAYNLSQSYGDKNAGNGKTLTPSLTFANAADAGNYDITTSTNPNGIITQAQLIYTAAAASREQDKDNPLLSGSISGVVSGENLAAITSGSLAWLTTATKSSPAGRYAINGSGLSVMDNNYLATILQAPGNATALTVRAQDAGYKNLLPWIIQGNDASSNGSQNPAGSGAPANGRANQNPQNNGLYAGASQPAPGGVSGAYALPGLPLSIIGSGINTGNHGIAAVELLNLSQLESR